MFLMLRKFRYSLEAIPLLLGMLLFRLLPLDTASAFGGWLGRLFGPLTRAHRVARTNMTRALPEMSERERQQALNAMWDNLGRTVGEYPHLARAEMPRRITVEGRENLEGIHKGAVFISGHFANWEIAPLTAALCGMPLAIVYRKPNNPMADWITRSIRSHYSLSMHKKGRDAAREVLEALRDDQRVSMHVDQKMSDGEPVMFFGYEAMTTTAATRLAIKLQLPLLAARVVRTDGAYFHVTLLPPVVYPMDASARYAMEEIHRLFEGWIRQLPSQWFWVHNRWNFINK